MKLSQAAMETLSIIAYNQPLTRSDIEMIRGINSDGAVKTLIARGLVEAKMSIILESSFNYDGFILKCFWNRKS